MKYNYELLFISRKIDDQETLVWYKSRWKIFVFNNNKIGKDSKIRSSNVSI